MAVYTKITDAQMKAFLRDYDLGAFEASEGIQQGVENTNYHVFMERGHFVLTIFEDRTNPADIPFFFSFTDHLSAHGIHCPRAIAARDSNTIRTIEGRPAVLVNFLQGSTPVPEDMTPDHCRQIGALSARMHIAAKDFPQSRENSMGLPAWRELARKTADRADGVAPGLTDLIAQELEYLEVHTPEDLPRAVVHADLFPDNVLFDEDVLSGVLDFYFSCTDLLVYDLMITANAWCFDADGDFNAPFFDALLEGYEDLRPLLEKERAALSYMGRAAALRIMMTRLHDWVFHDPAHFVKPKDPRDSLARLKFHQNEKIDR
ncbi:MAG TPA: homoserine kinase [Alphaproteobacteria bacterium]|jgi:homoserine kinase type II